MRTSFKDVCSKGGRWINLSGPVLRNDISGDEPSVSAATWYMYNVLDS
jgi:hypothetical protein